MKIMSGGMIKVEEFMDDLAIVWDDDHGIDICYASDKDAARRVAVLLELGWNAAKLMQDSRKSNAEIDAIVRHMERGE